MPPANQQNYQMPNQPSYGPVPGFDPNIPMPKPKKHINRLLIPFILTVLVLLGALGFGGWAFVERQDYKSNSDQKAAAAVAAAEQVLEDKKEAEFAEREKEPLRAYRGPATYGSLEISYPKTWSAFITESDKANPPIDGYMHPDFVPGKDSGTAFALRFQVTSTAYDQELRRFDSLVKQGKVQVSPTSVPNVPDVAGVRLTGEVEPDKQGTLVMFPLRDKTLKISSQSQVFAGDFDNIILKNLRFAP